MIVTVTANPALDLTYVLDAPMDRRVDVHRSQRATLEASGKGVNVSRTLHAAGVRTCAVLPVGGATGHHLEELLTADGVPVRTVRQSDSSRVNTTVLQPDGHTLKLNGPGPVLSGADADALVAAVVATLTETGPTDRVWLAVCGSLPPQTDVSLVTRLVRAAHATGARCVVDASGPALAAALEAGADLLSPNRAELAEIDSQVARSAAGVTGLESAVTTLAGRSGCELLVSLGAEGALWSDGRQTLHGHGPRLLPVNTAGAGDALLAGWLAEDGEPDDRLRRAVRWGRSACLTATTVDRSPGAGEAAVDETGQVIPEVTQIRGGSREGHRSQGGKQWVTETG